MASKENKDAAEIDLSSFEFVMKCGYCHPGGGPLEYDRKGNRYDLYARDPQNKIVSGGINHFDGDYFRAKWAESGVIEADCLICHFNNYDNRKRREQIKKRMNFKWAATVGAGLANVEGSVAKGETPKAVYKTNLFNKNGKVTLKITKEVLTTNCFFCHSADWHKKGTSYTGRPDVHIQAGLSCMDCHLTGRQTIDIRIKGDEVHHFGKGDDPGGFVRNDLDNTMRTCEDCHTEGILGAPIMKHQGLLSNHLRKIACETCHIPIRFVRAPLIKDSTVFNKDPHIRPINRIWSFYDPEGKPWNMRGETNIYTPSNQPLYFYRPVVGWYKGKIYPLSGIYAIFVGTKKKGETGVTPCYKKHMFKMWSLHNSNPDKYYPQLKNIQDDNQDGYIEVNRPNEIDAIISAVTEHLKSEGYGLEGKQVVFVKGDKVYTNATTWQILSKQDYEYSPYSPVFKLSHHVAPAKMALGANGCIDCHDQESPFLFKEVLVDPFDEHGKKITQPNFQFLRTFKD